MYMEVLSCYHMYIHILLLYLSTLYPSGGGDDEDNNSCVTHYDHSPHL